MTQLAIRLDPPTEEALDRLVGRTGQTRSEIAREAIIALDRDTLIAQMRAESLVCANDEADRAEARAVLAEMTARRAG